MGEISECRFQVPCTSQPLIVHFWRGGTAHTRILEPISTGLIGVLSFPAWFVVLKAAVYEEGAKFLLGNFLSFSSGNWKWYIIAHFHARR